MTIPAAIKETSVCINKLRHLNVSTKHFPPVVEMPMERKQYPLNVFNFLTSYMYFWSSPNNNLMWHALPPFIDEKVEAQC